MFSDSLISIRVRLSDAEVLAPSEDVGPEASPAVRAERTGFSRPASPPPRACVFQLAPTRAQTPTEQTPKVQGRRSPERPAAATGGAQAAQVEGGLLRTATARCAEDHPGCPSGTL